MSPFRRGRRRAQIADCLSDELHATLVAEGLLMLEERLRGSITYRRYREAGRSERTGEVEVVLRTPRAARLVELLTAD
jgi:hypothetical protein